MFEVAAPAAESVCVIWARVVKMATKRLKMTRNDAVMESFTLSVLVSCVGCRRGVRPFTCLFPGTRCFIVCQLSFPIIIMVNKLL